MKFAFQRSSDLFHRDLGVIGRAIDAQRRCAILPAVAACEAVLAPTFTARALAEFSAEIGRHPKTIIRRIMP